MTAFNVVRFRVKPGNEQRFIDEHRKVRPGFKGFLGGSLIKTGDQTFCIIGEWRNFQSLIAARPQMIAILDGLRDMLEDLGGGLGVTDPVSGEGRREARGTQGDEEAPRPRPPSDQARRREAHALAENLVAAILVPESTLALSAAAAAELGC
jgi:hypothetical protein